MKIIAQKRGEKSPISTGLSKRKIINKPDEPMGMGNVSYRDHRVVE